MKLLGKILKFVQPPVTRNGTRISTYVPPSSSSKNLLREPAQDEAESAIATVSQLQPICEPQAEVPELTGATEVVIEPVDPTTPRTTLVKRSRREIVYEHLCVAWDGGRRSYADLMEYVKQETGTGCARRMVSAWKKSQGLEGA